MDAAPIRRRRLPHDETSIFGAGHKLSNRVLSKLKSLDQLRNRRTLTPVRSTLDHQQQQLALGGETGSPRDIFPTAQEHTNRSPKRGGVPIVLQFDMRLATGWTRPPVAHLRRRCFDVASP
jgi:hypothetical protein